MCSVPEDGYNLSLALAYAKPISLLMLLCSSSFDEKALSP